MDKSPAKNPFDDITAEQVMEEAISQGVLKRFHDDLTIAVKMMGPYNKLMEKAEQNMLGANCSTKPISDSNIENAKKDINEVQLLTNQFEASASKYIDTIMATEGKHAIRNIITDLAFPKKESASKEVASSKTSQATDVGCYDESQPGSSKTVFEAQDSSESVSAVHVSELSSKSDEVEVPTKERGSNNKKRKIPSVNKASKSIVEEKKKTPIKQKIVKSSSKACVSSISKGSAEQDVLPKRKRKPNSRYGTQ